MAVQIVLALLFIVNSIVLVLFVLFFPISYAAVMFILINIFLIFLLVRLSLSVKKQITLDGQTIIVKYLFKKEKRIDKSDVTFIQYIDKKFKNRYVRDTLFFEFNSNDLLAIPQRIVAGAIEIAEVYDFIRDKYQGEERADETGMRH